MTARQIIEARLGRPLGPIAAMPKDTRKALFLLALQLLRNTAAAQSVPEIDDADPVPAALTAEGVPVFKTSRKLPRADSAAALSMGRDIAAMCGHDAGRIELFAAAVLGNANAAARTFNRWPADLGALDHG